MKNNINSFEKELEQELSEWKVQEGSFRENETQYKEALSNFQINNKKRLEKIKRIRLSIIEEIDNGLEKSNLELKKLKEESNSILLSYCNKYGHKYILVSRNVLGSTNKHSFIYGFQKISKNTYKCAICGRPKSITSKGYGSSSVKRYVKTLPEEIYDDNTLTTDGKTLRMVLEKISKLEEYIDYLESLKPKLCELLGHDYVEEHDSHFTYYECKCCGKYVDYIVKTDDADIWNNYLLALSEKSDLSLPTFESYQKTLTMGKIKKDNK